MHSICDFWLKFPHWNSSKDLNPYFNFELPTSNSGKLNYVKQFLPALDNKLYEKVRFTKIDYSCLDFCYSESWHGTEENDFWCVIFFWKFCLSVNVESSLVTELMMERPLIMSQRWCCHIKRDNCKSPVPYQ